MSEAALDSLIADLLNEPKPEEEKEDGQGEAPSAAKRPSKPVVPNSPLSSSKRAPKLVEVEEEDDDPLAAIMAGFERGAEDTDDEVTPYTTYCCTMSISISSIRALLSLLLRPS